MSYRLMKIHFVNSDKVKHVERKGREALCLELKIEK